VRDSLVVPVDGNRPLYVPGPTLSNRMKSGEDMT